MIFCAKWAANKAKTIAYTADEGPVNMRSRVVHMHTFLCIYPGYEPPDFSVTRLISAPTLNSRMLACRHKSAAVVVATPCSIMVAMTFCVASVIFLRCGFVCCSIVFAFRVTCCNQYLGLCVRDVVLC